MKRYIKLLFTMAIMVMGLSIVVSAQGHINRGSNYYGNTTTHSRNLKLTIRNLRSKSRRFENVVDHALDRSHLDGSRREDMLNALANRFKDAAEKLDDEYDNDRDFYQTRDEARRVLNRGSRLKRALIRSRVSRNYSVMNSWRSLNNDLRIISKAYNIGFNNRARNNRNQRYKRNRRQNLQGAIKRLRNKSSRFENRVDKEHGYNRGRYGSRVSSYFENLSDRFNDAVKDLDDEYDNNRYFSESYNEARRVLNIGKKLDRAISHERASRGIRRNWNSIERDLKMIARAYNLSYNRRNNR